MKIKSVVKSYMDSLLMITGMVIGAIVGIIWGEGASVLTNIADVFLNLLFCIVVPLVFISIVNSIAGLGSGCEFVCRMRKGAPGSWKKRERPENGLKPGFLGRKRPGKSGKSADFTT